MKGWSVILSNGISDNSCFRIAFAAGDEPGEYLDRRVIIWNLFFRMMTVAFTVGSSV